jgi:hypothetical protein
LHVPAELHGYFVAPHDAQVADLSATIIVPRHESSIVGEEGIQTSTYDSTRTIDPSRGVIISSNGTRIALVDGCSNLPGD